MKPNNLSVYFWRGVAQDELGDPKKAVQEYAKSLKLAKSIGMDSAELRINLGHALMKLNFIKEATYDYQRAIEIEPTNTIAYECLGRAHLRTGEFEKALDSFRKAEELGLSGANIAYLKALALAGLGQKQDALAELAPCLTETTKKQKAEIFKEATALFGALKSDSTQR